MVNQNVIYYIFNIWKPINVYLCVNSVSIIVNFMVNLTVTMIYKVFFILKTYTPHSQCFILPT